ncbi:TolC family protein [Granulosicoccus sp. 3-233]|uniref:TolC family protein n=1 Tax=Granulosicoccus sp. 3-233 TaxID=3417969 RepID=UPI003D33B082
MISLVVEHTIRRGHLSAILAIALLQGLCLSPAMAQSDAEDRLAAPTVDSAEDPESISFQTLLHKAMANNPAIDVAEARIDQAIELSRQNGSYRFPQVEISSTLGPEYNDPAPNTESGRASTTGRNLKLSVTQLLFDGGSSRAEHERSQRLEGAAHAEARIEVEDLFLDVVTHYIDYWRYQYELMQAEQFVTTMDELVADLGAMYRGGAASKLEVDFARARLASAQGVQSSATASLNNSLSELEYLVPGLRKFRAVSPEEFADIRLKPLADYIEQGAVSNSGFLTNRFSREATRLRVSAQKGRYLPSVDFELSGSMIDDEGGPSVQRDKFAAKLLINYTLYSGGERKGGVRRAEAQLRELEAERAQLERDVFRAIDQSYNSITSARLTLDAVLSEISANEDLQKLNRRNLELGSINIIELIDVEERLFNARSRKGDVVATMYQEYLDLMISAGLSDELLQQYSLQLPETD